MGNVVVTGVDRLRKEQFAFLKGRRIGLLTAPTGITSDFVSSIDVCVNLPTTELVALFACEHGIRGERQAGVLFEDETDPQLGIPIFSLYGKHRKPAEYMLDDLDAIVFDIQDLGVRFYTYLSTLVYVMESCLAYGKSLVVLDRPNPLGGIGCEGGFMRDGYYSMVGAQNIPAYTGLTIGEFARYVNGHMTMPCDLHVVEMHNWRREMEYPDTGLQWIMPSPNMPTIDTVRVYAGHCLFEGTNLSEGRGTTKPFEMIGAPWLDSNRTAKAMNQWRLPGVVFHPVTFTPMFSKHQGALCNGIFTYVTDKKAYRSAETGLHLLHQIMNLHTEFDWVMPLEAERKGKWFIDLLSGSDVLRTTVRDPAGLADIVAGWQADCEQWPKIREPYLLYEGASSYV
jgi:uncharacterized protein YbbC (DUF1343 family)